jgi:hypothetical protein
MTERKKVKMIVTVSVPKHISASAARREVRTLINQQCNYFAEPEDIRATGVIAAERKAA